MKTCRLASADRRSRNRVRNESSGSAKSERFSVGVGNPVAVGIGARLDHAIG